MRIGIAGRSTVLNPLLWLALLLLSALVEFIRYGAPGWMVIGLSVFVALVLLIALFTFIWFVMKDPSQLRSERFLERMQEIRMVGGDSLSGTSETLIGRSGTSGRVIEPPQENP